MGKRNKNNNDGGYRKLDWFDIDEQFGRRKSRDDKHKRYEQTDIFD